MAGRVYIFVPQLADDPPLNPLQRSFDSHADAIQEARTLLTSIAQLAGLGSGSVCVGEHPSPGEVRWLGTWRWTASGLWCWEAG